MKTKQLSKTIAKLSQKELAEILTNEITGILLQKEKN